MRIALLALLTLPTCWLRADPHFFYREEVPHHTFAAEALSDREVELINHAQQAIELAKQHISTLTPEILQIEGMSSTKGRALLNNLCTLPHTHYLEIGCWKGSTFVAALYNNQNTIDSATAIDDWSMFEGPRDAFHNHCAQFLQQVPFQFYSHDCFSLDPKEYIPAPVNIYFYDGGHTTEDQAKAFTHFNPILDDVFIVIVDDWNWFMSREGTFAAFRELGYTVLYEEALPAAFNGDRELWWNGVYVAVIRK